MSQRLTSLLAAGAMGVGLIIAGSTGVSAAGNGGCTGGTVAGGIYANLTISGFCTLDGGSVTVQQNLKVTSSGLLVAFFSNSTLTVQGNLIVQPGGSLGLGCDPEELPCLDNPDATSTNSVAQNLIVDAGVLIVVHDNHIGGNVAQQGGGGGFSCDPLFPNGPPAFTDNANNIIGGSASVTGLRTCWDGFSHNVVAGNVDHNDNQGSDPDANLIDGNHIAGSLRCFEDAPTPHLSDGPVQIKNVVVGAALGQCAAIST